MEQLALVVDVTPQERVKQRTCKRCQKQYQHVMGSTSTGTKYCADCKKIAYKEAAYGHNRIKVETMPCASCGVEASVRSRYWKLCDECWPQLPDGWLASLKRHHASIEFVLKVAQRQRCTICDRDLSARVKDHKARLRWSYALDHDHRCCPGQLSCGQCLRGLLCQRCNAAIGYLDDDAQRARALADYLDRFF